MTRKLTPQEQLDNQLILGQCRIGPEAAREIARKITGQHGFWDFEERKRAHGPQDTGTGERTWTVLGADRKVRTLTAVRGGQLTDKAA